MRQIRKKDVVICGVRFRVLQPTNDACTARACADCRNRIIWLRSDLRGEALREAVRAACRVAESEWQRALITAILSILL